MFSRLVERRASETCVYEMTRTFAIGFVSKGTRWRVPRNPAGIGSSATACQGLIADTGSGGFVFHFGDGASTTASKKYGKCIIAWRVQQEIFITGDFQEAHHPLYADRGPYPSFPLRVPLEY